MILVPSYLTTEDISSVDIKIPAFISSVAITKPKDQLETRNSNALNQGITSA